jgi:hypothetical protein
MRKENILKVKPTGNRIVDNTTVAIGGYITLEDYDGDHFQDGEKLKVLGYTLADEHCSKPFLHRGRFISKGGFQEVVYVVAVYSHATGKIKHYAQIFVNETEGYKYSQFNSNANETRLLRPAIKALRDMGMENAALVLEAQRATKLKDLLDRRSEILTDRRIRDEEKVMKVTAQMSIQKRVRIKTTSMEGEGVIFAADQHKLQVAHSDGHVREYTWSQVKKFELLCA